MATSEYIHVRERDRVAYLTLARPPLNVLNIAMLNEMIAELEKLSGRFDLCALVINAEGRLFSAGVDVPEHCHDTVAQMLASVHGVLRSIMRMPMPVIAAVHSGAYGGGMELALACDIILASDEAVFALPEIALGVFPPFAAAYLGEMVGTRRAMELVLTGRKIDAEEAQRIGMVAKVLPTSEFGESVESYLRQLRELSGFALRQAKSACRVRGIDTLESALDAIEKIYLQNLMQGNDPAEGLAAFMEKRRPIWRHS